MNHQTIAEELVEDLRAGASFQEMVSRLQDYKSRGMTRDEAIHTLESLRNRARDETEEDRILELLDVVTGFCSPQNSIWA